MRAVKLKQNAAQQKQLCERELWNERALRLYLCRSVAPQKALVHNSSGYNIVRTRALFGQRTRSQQQWLRHWMDKRTKTSGALLHNKRTPQKQHSFTTVVAIALQRYAQTTSRAIVQQQQQQKRTLQAEHSCSNNTTCRMVGTSAHSSRAAIAVAIIALSQQRKTCPNDLCVVVIH